MFKVLVVLAVIIAILLILIVVVQNSKDGGLAAGFAPSNPVMGVRKTTDFLEKATWSLVAIMAVLCIASAAFLKSGSQRADTAGSLREKVEEALPTPTATPTNATTLPVSAE